MKKRVTLAILIGCVYGLVCYQVLGIQKKQASDFTYPWLAARALWRGADPYAYVTQSITPWTHTLFYPATAGVVVLPLSWLSAQFAAAIFVGVACAWLAFAVTRDGIWRLYIFATGPAWQVAVTGQWSPLLMAAALTYPMLGLVIAKPNLALPLLAMQTERRAIIAAIIGGAALLGVSLVLQPAWPLRWYQTLHSTSVASQYRVPIFTAWGAVLAVAALRWRRSEGRLILGMALTSQNFFFYDQLPLFLVAQSRQQLIGAAVISWLAFYGRPLLHLHSVTTEAVNNQLLPFVILGLYLPALAMVLRRPNEGTAPAWVDRILGHAPRWLRGTHPDAKS